MNNVLQQLMLGKPKGPNIFKELLERMGAIPTEEQKQLEAMQKQQAQVQSAQQRPQVQPNQQDMMQAMRGMGR